MEFFHSDNYEVGHFIYDTWSVIIISGLNFLLYKSVKKVNAGSVLFNHSILEVVAANVLSFAILMIYQDLIKLVVGGCAIAFVWLWKRNIYTVLFAVGAIMVGWGLNVIPLLLCLVLVIQNRYLSRT